MNDKLDIFINTRNWLLENDVSPIETKYGNYWGMISNEKFINECLEEFDETLPMFDDKSDLLNNLKKLTVNVFNSDYDMESHTFELKNYVHVCPFRNAVFICNDIVVLKDE